MTDTNKCNPLEASMNFGKHLEECDVCKTRFDTCIGIIAQISEHIANTSEEM